MKSYGYLFNWEASCSIPLWIILREIIKSLRAMKLTWDPYKFIKFYPFSNLLNFNYSPFPLI